jgi:arylformamidase
MKRIVIATAMVLTAGAALAQRDGRVSRECRREVVQLCGIGNLRGCLREKYQQLGAQCQAELMARVRERAAQPGKPTPGATEIAYGSDPAQRFDLFLPKSDEKVPLVVFIHGGGWSIGNKAHSAAPKAAHFNGMGQAFASLNYRLVPKATVEQQAADIANALAVLRKQQGIDADRIVLMGHSAGAHLAALVAADPRYLVAAGVPMAAVRGVVLLDGAGYDVARQMARTDNQAQAMYVAAFGTDPARQRALSPITHAGAPDAPRWLVLAVATRADAVGQSRALGDALNRAGASARVVPVEGKTHMTLNRELGTPGDAPTAEVDRFVAAAFGG